MIAIAACVLAFVLTYFAGRRSLGQGLIVLLAFGYFYGIVRANLLTTFSHFIFDAGVLGLYLSQKWSVADPAEARRQANMRFWVIILMGWPLMVLLMPFQPFLISLVGLRGNTFFIPILLLATRLDERDVWHLSLALAVLNLVSLGFAGAEYLMSVEQFYPYSDVTEIIYRSSDVAGGYLRIPATFVAAHAYGGTMVGSLPFLFGAWGRAEGRFPRLLVVAGIGAALIGILMSATRQNFVLGVAMMVFALMTNRVKAGSWVVFIVLLGAVAWLAMTNERFQRFKSLGESDTFSDRVAGSVNRGFWEILAEYPMGNGLGGGGTSIPYFLQGQVRRPIGMESEYARLLCEQGIIGLLLWVAFVGWFLSRVRSAFSKGPWGTFRKLSWCLSAVCLGTAGIGIGLFNAIPQTIMLFLSMVLSVTPMRATAPTPLSRRAGNALRRPGYRLVPAG
jgi:hypothetical protein